MAYAGVPLVTRAGSDGRELLRRRQDAPALVGARHRPAPGSGGLGRDRDRAADRDRRAAVRRAGPPGKRGAVPQHLRGRRASAWRLISTDGRWLRVNRAVCDMLGCVREDLIGLPVEARTHPDDASADREAIRLLLAGECRTYTMEKRYRPAVGRGRLGPGQRLAGPRSRRQNRRTSLPVSRTSPSESRPRSPCGTARSATGCWRKASKEAVLGLGSGDRSGHLGRRHRTSARLSTRPSWAIPPPGGTTASIRPIGSGSSPASTRPSARARAAWSEEYRFRRADGSFAMVQDRAHIARDETGTPRSG